jgi:AcrR family transcriptional regulator
MSTGDNMVAGSQLGEAPKPAKRPRSAAATRAAILDSALRAFSRAGYDGVGTREIARDAGVTAMLVTRYFGSKEALFAAAVEVALAGDPAHSLRGFLRDVGDNFASEGNSASNNCPHTLAAGSNTKLAGHIANLIVAKTGPPRGPVDPILLVLRSAPNERAAAIIRDSIERHFERPLRTRLGGPWIAERVALLLAILSGFQLMRRVIRTEALTNGDSTFLEAQLAQLLQGLISGQASAAN